MLPLDDMRPGIFLQSTPLLDDTFFEDALILIAEHNEKGAVGFVVNQPLPRKLNELVEFRQVKPFPLYTGGPVDQEHLFFIHRRPDLIPGGVLIAGNIFLGGDFQSVVQHIDVLSEKDMKLFIGYCGWDDGELEEEVAEGSWEVVDERDPFQ